MKTQRPTYHTHTYTHTHIHTQAEPHTSPHTARTHLDASVGVDRRKTEIDAEAFEVVLEGGKVEGVSLCEEPGNDQYGQTVPATGHGRDAQRTNEMPPREVRLAAGEPEEAQEPRQHLVARAPLCA